MKRFLTSMQIEIVNYLRLFAAAAFAVLVAASAVPTHAALAAYGDILRGTIVDDTELYSDHSDNAQVVGSLTVGSTVQVADMGDGWFGAKFNGEARYFYGLDSFALYTAADSTVYRGAVAAGGVDLYIAPSYGSSTVDAFSEGATIQFVQFDDSYFMARVSGTVVYIPQSQVVLYCPQESGVIERWASPDGARAFTAPDYSSTCLSVLSAGTHLYFSDFDASWYMARMSFDGSTRVVFIPKADVLTEKPPTNNQPVVATKPEDGYGAFGYVTYQDTGLTLGEILDLLYHEDWVADRDGSWCSATKEDLRTYLNTANFPDGTSGFYQFMRLDQTIGMTVSDLNAFLSGKGVLEGHGQAFYDACREYGINEAYLVAHMAIETGNGRSTLAKGVYYDPQEDAAYKTVPEDPEVAKRAVKVHNMYGVGAVDSDPLGGGARYAYEHGWFSIDAAIKGGARFIANNYIHDGQNTLYEMNFDPWYAVDYGEQPWHQYATSVIWAYTCGDYISSIVSSLNVTLSFEVPFYAA